MSKSFVERLKQLDLNQPRELQQQVIYEQKRETSLLSLNNHMLYSLSRA